MKWLAVGVLGAMVGCGLTLIVIAVRDLCKYNKQERYDDASIKCIKDK